MTAYPVSARNRLRRFHERGRYDRAAVHAVLDAAPLCHVGYVVDGQPYVTPTLHWRDGDRLYWHGSAASRMLRAVADGVPVCVTATILDGLVLARSAFDHSANYRSAMLFGRARPLAGRDEKAAALHRMMAALVPGRWESLRATTDQELKATTVVAMPIEEASAKVRTGPPADDPADADAACWTGVLPLHHVWGEAEPDPAMTDADAPPVPEGVRARAGRKV